MCKKDFLQTATVLPPGHFVNPIQEIKSQNLSKDESQPDPRAIFGCAEIKEIKSYLYRASKEIRMVMEDEKRKIRRSSVPRVNESTAKTQSKVKELTQECTSPRSPIHFEKSISKEVEDTMKNSARLSSTQVNFGIPQPEAFSIKKNAKEIHKRWEQVQQRLEEEKEKQLQNEEMKEKEWKKINKTLKKYEEKCTCYIDIF